MKAIKLSAAFLILTIAIGSFIWLLPKPLLLVCILWGGGLGSVVWSIVILSDYFANRTQ